jgi:hypothetical protein
LEKITGGFPVTADGSCCFVKITGGFPVTADGNCSFANETGGFQVVEKVKKRELSYKKRWGKGAESEAVDFKIVL